jgi:hypothetical protein
LQSQAARYQLEYWEPMVLASQSFFSFDLPCLKGVITMPNAGVS